MFFFFHEENFNYNILKGARSRAIVDVNHLEKHKLEEISTRFIHEMKLEECQGIAFV